MEKWLTTADASPANLVAFQDAVCGSSVTDASNPISDEMATSSFTHQPPHVRAADWQQNAKMVLRQDAGVNDEDTIPRNVVYAVVCSPWWCHFMAVVEDE